LLQSGFTVDALHGSEIYLSTYIACPKDNPRIHGVATVWGSFAVDNPPFAADDYRQIAGKTSPDWPASDQIAADLPYFSYALGYLSQERATINMLSIDRPKNCHPTILRKMLANILGLYAMVIAVANAALTGC
jgi:hypothetical protein